MKRLFTILFLVCSIPAFAQLGSQTGAYGSVGLTAAQIAANLPGSVVTNGSSPTFTHLFTSDSGTFEIGNGIGGANAAIDPFVGFRVQPPSGANNGYYFYNQGGSSQLSRYGTVNALSTGQNISDPVTGSHLPFWWDFGWGDPSAWSYGGYNNIAVTREGIYGGDGSVLEGLPNERNEIGLAMPLPPFVLTSFFAAGINTNEVAITNMLAMCAASGLTAAITNSGGQLWVNLDDTTFFFNQHRDAQGYLSINLTNFPDGSNFAAVVHSYGANLIGTLYWYKYPTNEVDYTAQGGFTVGYPGYPAMTPNSVDSDVSKIYDMGFDGLRVADIGIASATGAQMAYSRRVLDADLNPLSLGAFKLAYGTRTVDGGKGMTKPIALEMLTTRIGYTTPSLYKQCNLVDHDASGFPGYISSSINEVAWMQNWRGSFNYEIPFRGPGHYGQAATSFITGTVPEDLSLGDTRLALTMDSIGLAKVMFGFQNTNVPLTTIMPNFVSQATNAAFLGVLFDSLCQPPVKIFDNGPTNTSAWCRPLNNGAVALALVNESANPTNITFNLASCGLDTSKQYAALDVWSNLTYVAGASYTYSNVPALSAALVKIYPAALTNYMPWTWTPIPQQVIYRGSNNWEYAITTGGTNAAYKINP